MQGFKPYRTFRCGFFMVISLYTTAMQRLPLSRTGEWIIALASLWFIGGLYLDGWAHNHRPELESFFTPWHAVFYTGYFAVAFSLLFFTWKNMKTAKSISAAIPAGYEYAMIGVLVFFVGGIADMAWHEILGVEADIEALLSPTHLVLAAGATLMGTGAFRSWYRKDDLRRDVTLLGQLPMLIAALFILSLLTFMTQFAHFVDLRAAGNMPETLPNTISSLTIMSYLFPTILMMGTVFLILRRGRLARGAMTFLLTVNVLGMALMRENEIVAIAAIVAGIVADVWLLKMQPVEQNIRSLRAFSFVIPFMLFCIYSAITLGQHGTWWSVHMWAGAPVLAGIAGVLLSFLVWPMQTDARPAKI